MRSSTASTRSSSSRRISVCAKGSNARSASGDPRQSASASRSFVARPSLSSARLNDETLEAAQVDAFSFDWGRSPAGA